MMTASDDAAPRRRELEDTRTQIAELERELAETRSLVSLGRLTLSIAHDFRNVMAVITGQSELVLESVSAANGETVRVDTEGAIRDRSQTTQTEERAAIGTAVGAIIGAIAGGGRGAAIGAILGAGAGAGSVYVEGQDALELYSGTEMVIRAGAPNNIPR